MRNVFKETAKVICCIILSALVGVGLLSVVFLIPTDRMEEHLVSSADIIAQEGTYPYSESTGKLDNYTDSIILLNSAHKNEGPFMENVLMGKRYFIEGKNPVDSLVGIYKNKETDYTTGTYQWYWHGYLIFTKPLLYFMDYSSIRIFNMIMAILVICVTIFCFIKKKLYALIIPYILSIMLLKPIGIFNSLQYSACFYIMSASILAMLLIKDTKKYGFYVFLFSGILTAYLDFLTYPIATFGVAAAIYFAITCDAFKNKFLNLIKIFSLWCIGYVGMWASKWILCFIFFRNEIFEKVKERFIFRSSLALDEGDYFSLWNAFESNIKQFLDKPMALLIFAFVLVSGICIVVYYKKKPQLITNHIKNSVLFLILAILPFLWYAFTINHSVIHSFFTNKALVVSAFSGLCVFSPVIDRLSKQ